MRKISIALTVLVVSFFTPNLQYFSILEKLYFPTNNISYIICTKEKLEVQSFGGFGEVNFYFFSSMEETKNINIDYLAVISESVEVPVIFNDRFLIENKINIVQKESYEDFMLYYCYSKSLNKNLIIQNKVFNLQIAIYENCYKVGYPAIMDGF